MSKHAVIVISDLHLGRGNKQDSFTKDKNAIATLGEALVTASKNEVETTLVLNGDVIDLWEIVPDTELAENDNRYEVITDGLNVPTTSAQQHQSMVKNVDRQIGEALGAHPEFTALLKKATDQHVRLHFNIGNHDHLLESAKVRQSFRKHLKGYGVSDNGQVTIGRFFLDPVTGSYAEHGDRFADDDSTSPVDAPEGDAFSDATGFYFLRYVWNRMELEGFGFVDSAWGVIRNLDKVLTHGGALSRFVKYSPDYWWAIKKGVAPEPRSFFLAKLYDLWKGKNAVLGMRGFAAVPRVELTADDVRQVLATVRPKPPEEPPPAAFRGAAFAGPWTQEENPPAWLPGKRYFPVFHVPDDFSVGLRKRFDKAFDGYPKLDQGKLRMATLGHTHKELRIQLFDTEQPLYLNSGSWTKGGTPTFAWSYREGDQVNFGLRQIPST